LSYFESRLKVDFNIINDIKDKLEICEKIHIRNLILEPIDNLQAITKKIKKIIENYTKIKIYYRCNLTSKNINEFRRDIKKYGNFPGILSLESSNKNVQMHASKDSRIDLISFSKQEIITTITPGIISLVKQNKKFIEFSLSPIFLDNKSVQSKNFRNLYRSLRLIRNYNADYIISGNFIESFQIRHPRALLSICHTLLEIPLIEAKKIFRQNPIKLLNNVQNRLNNKNVEEGVSLLRKRGEKH
jgi:RNase P/RNase MRP subunit p30